VKEKRFRKSIAVVAILGTSFSMTGCSCVESITQEILYGPPPGVEEIFTPSSDVSQDVYEQLIIKESEQSIEEFDPSEEIPVTVYGSPNVI